jgi:hypothetical protein
MSDIDKEVFAKWMDLLEEIAGRNVSDDVHKFYYSRLNDRFDTEGFKRVAQEVAESTRFFPPVEKFLEAGGGLNSEDQAELAWLDYATDQDVDLPEYHEQVMHQIKPPHKYGLEQADAQEERRMKRDFINQYVAVLNKMKQNREITPIDKRLEE